MVDQLPDLNKYSLEQLHEVLRSIDRESYPERLKEVEDILADPSRYEQLVRQQEELNDELKAERKENEKVMYFALYAIMGTITLITGTLFARSGVHLGATDSWLTRIMVFFVFCFIAISFLKSLGEKDDH